MARVKCPNCGTEFDIVNHDSMYVNSFHDCTNNVIGELKAAKINNNNTGYKNMENTELMNLLKGIMTDEQMRVLNAKLNGSDEIAKKIIEETPFIRNVDFDLQHTTAQTFRLLNYNGGWTEGFKELYTYEYTLQYLATITKRMAKLQKENTKMFMIELNFFNRDVIVATLEKYVKLLQGHLSNLKTHKCRGKSYVKVGRKHYCDKEFITDNDGNMFVENLEKTFVAPVNAIIEQIKRTTDYKELYTLVNSFLNPKLHWVLKIQPTACSEWVDAFKKRGAYFSFQNIIRHSGVRLHDRGAVYDKYQSLDILNSQLKGKGWELLGSLKEEIKLNNFSFNKLMAEKYSA